MQKTVIERNGKNFQYWRDLWRYRGLALNLARRDITVRYKQTVIGIGWSVLGPLMNMLIMSFIFGTVAKLPSDSGVPYRIMVYAGLIPWTLFGRSLTIVSSTFLSNASLLKKVYFPRIIAPLGEVTALLIDTLISCGVLAVMMALYRYVPPFERLALLPVFLLMTVLLGFSLGMTLAPFNVKHRDLNQILPFMIQLGQYVTPVVYSYAFVMSTISPTMGIVYTLNPATGIVNAFKWCVIADNPFDMKTFLISAAWIAVLLPIGIIRFRKAERTFVDLV
ncbi:MAG TPA: ABC transporter permease [Clostridiales bacterium]|nr:ABC transporter permease [Clostridiales bacterium]HQH62301.1 ABC transporter permease [Clostridiales bacterium]HQK72277.1 ABC transporter permease [Clostridiales bacterium]